MTRTVTTRRPPHAVVATATAAIGAGVRVIEMGFSGNGESTGLCVRSALGA